MAKRLPFIVVLGATACGKSKLGIELARRFGGEVISADSMQVYRGLDIVTNKVTEEEQLQAKHHMINILDPLKLYSVIDFRNQALDIIDSLFANHRLPIVVGGTNYYIESLLWECFTHSPRDDSNLTEINQEGTQTLIDSENQILKSLPKESLHTESDLTDIEKFFSKPIYNSSFRDIESERLWQLLEQVDTNAAHLYHPNDKRRVIRCLQLIQRKKKSYTKLLKEANKSSQEDKPSLGGPLRFNPTCVLWLSCDDETLNQVLNNRVDDMLNRGLLSELETFHQDYNKQRIVDGLAPDYTKGIFQTIGFKEFHSYFMLDEKTRSSSKGNEVLKKSIEDMKCATRRYARRQMHWIRSRILRGGTRDLPPLFNLPISFDENLWIEQVTKPAIEIVESFIEDKPLSDKVKAMIVEPLEETKTFAPGKYFCEACDRMFVGSTNIQAHLKSRNHKRRLDAVREVYNNNTVDST